MQILLFTDSFAHNLAIFLNTAVFSTRALRKFLSLSFSHVYIYMCIRTTTKFEILNARTDKDKTTDRV